jgi:nucleoside-diphosphate-sugar epimerase
VPGIYAADRLPLERLRLGTPAICAEQDSFSNHVHADDLAQIMVRALVAARPCRVYNASDDSALRMGDYFDLVADRFDMPRPRRISREQAQIEVPPALLSFMRESRQLTNERLKRELRVRLRYPRVADGVAAAAGAAGGNRLAAA